MKSQSASTASSRPPTGLRAERQADFGGGLGSPRTRCSIDTHASRICANKLLQNGCAHVCQPDHNSALLFVYLVSAYLILSFTTNINGSYVCLAWLAVYTNHQHVEVVLLLVANVGVAAASQIGRRCQIVARRRRGRARGGVGGRARVGPMPRLAGRAARQTEGSCACAGTTLLRCLYTCPSSPNKSRCLLVKCGLLVRSRLRLAICCKSGVVRSLESTYGVANASLSTAMSAISLVACMLGAA